jgi:hypothetical protein
MDKLIGLNTANEIEASNGAKQASEDVENVRLRAGVPWIRNNEYTMSYRNTVFALLNNAIHMLSGAHLMQPDKVSFWIGYIGELQYIIDSNNMFGIRHVDVHDFPFVDADKVIDKPIDIESI